jgi:hypothetical protein
MMMGEKLVVLKYKPNHIHHKGLFYCASKPTLTKEQINIMIQLEDKTNVKNNKLNVCKLINHESFFPGQNLLRCTIQNKKKNPYQSPIF